MFGNIFLKHRRDAILLHAPFPPRANASGNSKFGGLPRLPAGHEWPRTSDNLPLHFLAQIDCSDLPRPSPLPDRGVLFFFGRDDSEQVWNHDRPTHDDCRVIHAPDATAATALRPAPADLPPIADEYGLRCARDFLLDDEAGPNVHIEWPVQPLAMPSWPEVDALPKGALKPKFDLKRLFGRTEKPVSLGGFATMRPAAEIDYIDSWEARRIAAFCAATGETPDDAAEAGYDSSRILANALWGTDDAVDAFPQRWQDVTLFARQILGRRSTGRTLPPTAREGAQTWLAAALGQPGNGQVPSAERAAFRAWVSAWQTPPASTSLHYVAEDFVVKASLYGLQLDTAAGLTPAETTAALLRPQFRPFNGEAQVHFAQMLGHAASSQTPRPVDDPAICLLQLSSYAPNGWMFGDMGECTFWILPEDLARRDFSKVWATIEGG